MLPVAILAGGRSERMGRDKALMPFLGRPLILRIIERLRSLTDDLFVMTDRPADYAFPGIPIHSDLEPGRGASPSPTPTLPPLRSGMLRDPHLQIQQMERENLTPNSSASLSIQYLTF
jgi:hypothetical protein